MKGLLNHSSLYSACNGCERRSEDCHNGCSDYAAEVIMGVLTEASERKALKSRVDLYAVAQKRAYRISKRSRDLKRAMRSNPYVKSR